MEKFLSIPFNIKQKSQKYREDFIDEGSVDVFRMRPDIFEVEIFILSVEWEIRIFLDSKRKFIVQTSRDYFTALTFSWVTKQFY